MKIGIVLAHNKSDEENARQIDLLSQLIVKQEQLHNQYDQDGNVVGQFKTYYYNLLGFPKSLQVLFFQVVPYGVKVPENIDLLDSAKVFYGEGDQDVRDSRFFNWGSLRAFDKGCSVVAYLDKPGSIDVEGFIDSLQSLGDPRDKTDFMEAEGCLAIAERSFKEVGRIAEDKKIKDGLLDYKLQISRRSDVQVGFRKQKKEANG